MKLYIIIIIIILLYCCNCESSERIRPYLRHIIDWKTNNILTNPPANINELYNIHKLLNLKPLNASISNSFQHYTITKRIIDVIEIVIEDRAYDNGYSDKVNDIENKLNKLKIDILNNNKIPCQIESCINLDDRTLSNSEWYSLCDDWHHYLQTVCNQKYMEAVPAISVEMLIYRRILEITDYFNSRRDPFIKRKRQLYDSNLQYIQQVASLVVNSNTLIFEAESRRLSQLIHASLWANQASDLALKPKSRMNDQFLWMKKSSHYLLANNTIDIIRYLLQKRDTPKLNFARRSNPIGIILDNGGAEVVSDLALAVFLLQQKFTSRIVLLAKRHPIFVSDVTYSDLKAIKYWLKSSKDFNIKWLGKKIEEYWNIGQIIVDVNYFSTSPLMYFAMPKRLGDYLSKFQILIVKGDANYRRLLGDMQWPNDVEFSKVVGYLPVSVAALRCVKSELYVDYDNNRIPYHDKTWLRSGKYGSIQFSSTRHLPANYKYRGEIFLAVFVSVLVVIITILIWNFYE